jgi:hypothetical protein
MSEKTGFYASASDSSRWSAASGAVCEPSRSSLCPDWSPVDGATTPAGGIKVSPSSVSSCIKNVSHISINYEEVSNATKQRTLLAYLFLCFNCTLQVSLHTGLEVLHLFSLKALQLITHKAAHVIEKQPCLVYPSLGIGHICAQLVEAILL